MAISKHADVAIEMEKNVQKQRHSPVERHKCPRCHSENTKFCYFNNYSLSQPRYFCKACKRYWTKGGALRNIPFGGSGGKSKRGRKSDALMSTATGYCTDHHQFTPPPASLLTSTLNEQLQHEIFFSNSSAGGAVGGNNIGSIFHQGLYGHHDHCSVTNHGLIGASGGGIQQQQIVQLQKTTLPFPVQSEPLWINEFIMPWPAPTIIGSSSSPSASYSSIPLFNQHGYRSFW